MTEAQSREAEALDLKVTQDIEKAMKPVKELAEKSPTDPDFDAAHVTLASGICGLRDADKITCARVGDIKNMVGDIYEKVNGNGHAAIPIPVRKLDGSVKVYRFPARYALAILECIIDLQAVLVYVRPATMKTIASMSVSFPMALIHVEPNHSDFQAFCRTLFLPIESSLKAWVSALQIRLSPRRLAEDAPQELLEPVRQGYSSGVHRSLPIVNATLCITFVADQLFGASAAFAFHSASVAWIGTRHTIVLRPGYLIGTGTRTMFVTAFVPAPTTFVLK